MRLFMTTRSMFPACLAARSIPSRTRTAKGISSVMLAKPILYRPVANAVAGAVVDEDGDPALSQPAVKSWLRSNAAITTTRATEHALTGHALMGQSEWIMVESVFSVRLHTKR